MPFTLNAHHHGGTTAGRINPCTGRPSDRRWHVQRTPPSQTAESPSSSRLCECVPRSRRICLPPWSVAQTGQTHSGLCHCPLLEVWCFLTRKGLKSPSTRRVTVAQPGHQEHVQALSSPEVPLASALCVWHWVCQAFLAQGLWCPLRHPHTRWVKVMVTLLISFPKTQGRGGS